MGDLAATSTVVGFEIPSDSPVFLAVLAVHVPLGLACVLTGLSAMVQPKRRGRHTRPGTGYYWCLAGLCTTSTGLAAMRWAEDYSLFVLGVSAFGAATAGRWWLRLRRGRWWLAGHILGMSGSYVLMLTAFYLDNARNLPLWRDLPLVTFWFLPASVAAPFVVRALRRHQVAAYGPSPHTGRRARQG